MKRIFFLFGLVFSLSLLVSCSGNDGGAGFGDGSTGVNLSLHFPGGSSDSGSNLSSAVINDLTVATVRVTVCGAGMADIVEVVGVSPPDVVTITLDVPNGSNRHFVIECMDAGGVVTWVGDYYYDVGASSGSVTLDVNMDAYSGSPSVSSTTPTADATGVAVNTTISATFAGPVDSATLTTTTFTVNNGSTDIAGTVSYDWSTKVVTFTPSANLSYTATYDATLSTAVKDVLGVPFSTDYTWAFTTADGTAPLVSSTIPANGATEVALASTVAATFNETMTTATVNTTTFTVNDGASNIAGAVGPPSTNTFTFTPSANLEPNTVYTATITAGALDLAGNPLAANANNPWSFTTQTTFSKILMGGVNYSNGVFYDGQQTADGGFVAAGSIYVLDVAGNYTQAVLAKFAADGTLSWANHYGSTITSEIFRAVKQTADGGYIVAGDTNLGIAGTDDFWVVKTDSSGNITWNKAYGTTGHDNIESIDVVTGVSGIEYVVTGTTYGLGPAGAEIWALALDGGGDVVWTFAYGELSNDSASKIYQASDQSGFLVAGSTSSFGGADTDYSLMKLDNTGVVVWQYTYVRGLGTIWDYLYSASETSDGHVLAGQTYNGSDNDMWVVKVSSDGSTITWQKLYGVAGNEERANDLRETGAGAVIVAGTTRGVNESPWIVSLDSSGNVQWEKQYNGTYDRRPLALGQNSDGGYFAVGDTYDDASIDPESPFMMRLTGDGTLGCSLDSPTTATVINTTAVAQFNNSGSTGDIVTYPAVENTNYWVNSPVVTPTAIAPQTVISDCP
ncbi:MAG: Ig-like domain-containing protein [Proteobacteria bacterium]|nr:Ig-like domain-containing protein [Pseudomonadota bacterium]MBU1709435.1 Ig-like domain-containing protein [Pseudomonadota bacterium]